jgi:hypothetical protein
MVEKGNPLKQDAADIGRAIGGDLVGAQCANINVSIFSKFVPLHHK